MRILITLFLLVLSNFVSANISKEEVSCMVKTMHSEAYSYGDGWQAVAHVIWTRHQKSNAHVCSITRAPGQFTSKPVNDKKLRMRMEQVAHKVATNKARDITHGATNFFTASDHKSINDFKRKGYVVTATIGGNVFMKKAG